MVTIEPEDLIGKSFSLPPREDGARERAYISGLVEEYEDGILTAPHTTKFRYTVNGKECDDLKTYSPILDSLKDDKGGDDTEM
jgi:hypothetical protein